jgi:DNA-binding beta-propeller fold protein YncE
MNGEFDFIGGVGVAPNATVYVADRSNHRLQYFTAAGSFLGKWGSYGTGNGEFIGPFGVAVSDDGRVFVAEYDGERVQYFTSTGSFLGKWGKRGGMKGEFLGPADVAVTADGGLVYVVETFNHRVQYFRWSEPAVVPTSLGRIKALFE